VRVVFSIWEGKCECSVRGGAGLHYGLALYSGRKGSLGVDRRCKRFQTPGA
jgi:hypothetical protein